MSQQLEFFDDVTCLINALLMTRWCETFGYCLYGEQGAEGGGGQGTEGGLAQNRIARGESDHHAESNAANPSAAPTSPESDTPAPEEAEDPAFAARWNAFVTWLDANSFESHSEMTEAEWDAWATQKMVDIVFEGVRP